MAPKFHPTGGFLENPWFIPAFPTEHQLVSLVVLRPFQVPLKTKRGSRIPATHTHTHTCAFSLRNNAGVPSSSLAFLHRPKRSSAKRRDTLALPTPATNTLGPAWLLANCSAIVIPLGRIAIQFDDRFITSKGIISKSHRTCSRSHVQAHASSNAIAHVQRAHSRHIHSNTK